MDLEISKLIQSGAVVKCQDTPGQFMSNIFLIPKKDGSFRFILNLKKLNKYIRPLHFKMEDIRTTVKLMSKNCFMATLDLKEAYFLVSMHDDSRKYLRFRFLEQNYEFQCLPMGLSLAPFVFTKLLKPVISHLRNKGLLIIVYLDDLICIGNSYDDCLSCVTETIKLLEHLGFVINYPKSCLIPSQVQTFLGFELDSSKMCIRLPNSKRERIFDLLNKVINHTKVMSIRDFARFLGVLCASCPAVAYGWGYTKRLEREKYLALRDSNEDYECLMSLSADSGADLLWWKNNIMVTSNPIRAGHYSLEIFSDASTTGWGVSCRGERASGFWDETEVQSHINLLELKAAFFGLKCFASNLRNKEILLRIDNTTALSYINRAGGVQFTHLNDIARDIWVWCEQRQLFIYAAYIKSKENVEADEESRRLNIDTEWSLSARAFNKILRRFGQAHIDLFATRLNAKCCKYVSWKRDPDAYNIDAFTLDWNNYFFYAFPPFSLILKSLRKIVNDKATGVMVVPYWPSQAWYPLFMSLSQGDPLYLKPDFDLLVSPFRTAHPLWKRLTLVVSKLSGERF
jgi:hypothetical protein